MKTIEREVPAELSAARGRLYLVLAAVLWSLSGAFTKILTKETPLHLGDPPVPALWIAFYRVLFAGLALLPTLRRRDLSFRKTMPVMMLCFAIMNALYVAAMAGGKAANAVLLQYTAPLWMYLAGIWWLGETADRRGWVALVIGLAGIGVILGDGWREAQLDVAAIALASGVAYAGVILCLRVLRDCSPRWLTVLNHLSGALVLLPLLWIGWPAGPRPAQIAVLFVFGTVQMALPYWLAARGLKVVSVQEAGIITLLEPFLNPLWAYLVSPGTERPSAFTLIGGGFILGGLAYRYWPRGR
jgi:drug/metabolite transporter (DMT)-like permease